MAKFTKEQIKACEKMGMSAEDIKELEKSDNALDIDKTSYKLDTELETGAKKARSTGTHTVYNFTKRERKPKPEKKRMLELMANAVDPDTIEVINEEREVEFTKYGKRYKIVLSEPRVKKARAD